MGISSGDLVEIYRSLMTERCEVVDHRLARVGTLTPDFSLR